MFHGTLDAVNWDVTPREPHWGVFSPISIPPTPVPAQGVLFLRANDRMDFTSACGAAAALAVAFISTSLGVVLSVNILLSREARK